MTASYLLDANVLIALSVTDHEHHARAARWVATVDAVAVCPISEGALARFIVRVGGGAATVQLLMTQLQNSSRCEFWEDSLSYAEIDLAQVTGHRQVTDAYLVGLAASHGARLATFDRSLTATSPETAFLIP